MLRPSPRKGCDQKLQGESDLGNQEHLSLLDLEEGEGQLRKLLVS